MLGRRNEADEHLRRARDLDPFSTATAANSTIFFEMEGRLAEARELTRQMSSQNPNIVVRQIALYSLDARLGEADSAIPNLRKLAGKEPLARLALAGAEASVGHREEALGIIRPLEKNYQAGDIPMYQFALFYAGLDDEPATVKWLKRSMEAREAGATHIRAEAAFAKWQNTPEFHAMKKRLNLDY
jgi:tetratricopeptide (TPR) repeat protein